VQSGFSIPLLKNPPGSPSEAADSRIRPWLSSTAAL
jgi:hypothetical protein